MLDLLIIGAGPAGISAAFEAQKLNLNYLVLEKNLIGNTIYNYPIGLTVFSTVNELELQPNTLFPAREKPTREELLSYYTGFVLENNLNVQWEEAVTTVEKRGANHFVISSVKGEYEARNVLFAFGAMQYPRRLGAKGEDLPKVHHLFRETYPYVRKNAMVVGGGNSAGEAALFLAQEGANATLATFRKDWEETDPKQGCIKHWVKEPLEAQLEKNCLDVFFLGGASVKLFLDKSSHLLVMASFTDAKPFIFRVNPAKTNTDGSNVRVTADKQGEARTTEFQIKFSDYRSVNGVQMPYKWTQTVGGKDDETIDVSSYEINPANIAEKFNKTPQKIMIRTKKPE